MQSQNLASACASDPLLSPAMADPLSCGAGSSKDESLEQVRSVDELSDVQPTDWAYQALKSLVEKYGVIAGYADRTFRGNRALTRYEFAATLNNVMVWMEQYLAQAEFSQLQDDFATLRRLQESYQAILADQRDRITKLETTASRLEQQQFSTTTKLNGQVVLGITNGSNANSTIPARVRLDLNTSFTGKDLLRTQLEAGNNSGDAISKQHATRGLNLLGTSGILADGGGLDYIEVPNTVRLSKLYYTFQPLRNLNLTIGGRLNPRDFIDYNRFANDSLTNFNSSFFMNNPLIVQNQVDRSGGAGAAISWKLGDQSPFVLRALYVAADGNDPLDGEGLFGGRNQGTVELEYTFRNFVTRLQYTSATVNRTAINAGGINLEWAFNRQFSIFGRVGMGRYSGFNSQLQQNLSLSPVTWALGGTIREILIPGSVAGVAIGQPFIEGDLGDATQTNFELYYSFDLNDRISFSPAFLVVANPNNRSTGTVFEWVVRLVYAF
ncbi:MAG: iron uptake porin [Leptolyngbyaceae cyanobacterium bins.302]|nr:iron uptake porin [Leptolyngbyaceae cyanobacterium bins.302]